MEQTNDERKWIIYMYTFPNGKRYIGKTCKSLKERQGSSNFNHYKSCPVLWRAIQKYGTENIQQDILFEDYMTDEYSDRLEMLCIALFKTNCNRYKNPEYGYNCDDGGGGVSGFRLSDEAKEKIKQANIGHVVTEETKEKISKANKGKFSGDKNPNYGKHASDELRKKLSESQKRLYTEKGYINPRKGKRLSDEQKQKLREINIGKKASEETKKKMSESRKNRQPPAHKFVCCEELDLVFFSMRVASDYTQISHSGIGKCCTGIQKTSGGYHWHYATEEEIKQHKIIDRLEVEQ